MDIHTYELSVLPEDIDQLRHINNVAYLRFVQEAAESHWKHLACENSLKDYIWVARRHEIDYLKQAYKPDKLIAKTYVVSFEGAKSIRIVEIHRGTEKIVVAKTIWVLLDANSYKPRRVPSEIIGLF